MKNELHLLPLRAYTILIALFLVKPLSLFAQLYESFETGLPASYNSTLSNVSLNSGTWQIKDVQAGTNGVQSGIKSAQLRSATASQIISPLLQNGVSIVSFYVSASTASGAYQVNVSSDGGITWTPAPGSPFTIGTSKSFRQINLNSFTVNKIQIYRTGAVLYIDDIDISIPQVCTVVQAPNSLQTSYGNYSSIDSFKVLVNQAQTQLYILPPPGIEVATQASFNSFVGNSMQVLSLNNIPANTIVTCYTRISATANAGNYNGNFLISNATNQSLQIPMPTSIVFKAPQNLSINTLPTWVYKGDNPFQLQAQSNANLALELAISDTTKARYGPNGLIQWLDTGMVELTLYQTGNSNYLPVDTQWVCTIQRPACLQQQAIVTYKGEINGIANNQATNDSLWQVFISPLQWESLNAVNSPLEISSNTFTSNNDPNNLFHFSLIVNKNSQYVDSAQYINGSWYVGMGQQTQINQIQFQAQHHAKHPVQFAIRSSYDNFQSNWLTGFLNPDTMWHNYTFYNLNYHIPANSDTLHWRWYIYQTPNNPDTNNYVFRFDNLAFSFYTSNKPDSAFTGPDQIQCGQLQSSPLGGNMPTLGIGTWSKLTGPGNVTFNQIHEGNTMASVDIPGVYTFRWTINHPDCTQENHADIQVHFSNAPTWDYVTNTPGNCYTDSAEININVLGGQGPYTFKLNNQTILPNTFKLIQGMYTIIASDALNCSVTTQVQVVPATPLQIIVQVTPPSCFGQLALLTILAQGGNGGYSYNINGAMVNPSSNVNAGIYTITVTDITACTVSSIVNVVSPPDLQLTYTLQSPQCINCTYTLIPQVTGGTPPYQIQVNGQNGNPSWSLNAGNYTLNVQDAQACFKTILLSIAPQIIPNNYPPIKITKQTFGHSALISWEGNANDSSYRLDIKPFQGGIWTAYRQTSNYDTLFSLTPNTMYVIRLKTYDSGGVESAWVHDTFQTTFGCNSPSYNTISLGSSSCTLNWHADSATDYRIEYKHPDSLLWRPITTTQTQRRITGLLPATAYTFRIRSSCFLNDRSAWHDTVLVTQAPVSQPVWQTPIINGNSIRMAWRSCLNAQAYRIEFKPLNHTIWQVNILNDTSIVYYGLSPQTMYECRVQVREIDGDTSEWITAMHTTSAGCIPPQFDSPYVQGNSACLFWNAVADSAYRFEYKAIHHNLWLASLHTGTQYCIQNLVPNTAYVCRIKSICKNNDQSIWQYDTLYTTAGCSLPIITTKNVISNSMHIAWTHPSASQFRLEYKANSAPTWQSLKLKMPYRTISNLTTAQMYQIRLRAECPNGDVSAWEYDSVFTPSARFIDTIFNSDTTMVQSIYIYPNPANQVISLQYPVTTCERVLCRIVDPIGRIVYEEAHQICPGNPLSIPLHHLNQGVYTFSLENQHQVRYNRRFVKE